MNPSRRRRSLGALAAVLALTAVGCGRAAVEPSSAGAPVAGDAGHQRATPLSTSGSAVAATTASVTPTTSAPAAVLDVADHSGRHGVDDTVSGPPTAPEIVADDLVDAPISAGIQNTDIVVGPYPARVPFTFDIGPVSAARLGSSWRVGCPVSPSQLVIIVMPYWGYDRLPRTGELIVNASVVWQVAAAFEYMWIAHYPIQLMATIEAFGSSDDASMDANNTSAFNCRYVAGTTRWSNHAYGLAIDVNPLQNPYVSRTGSVFPPGGAPYVNRSLGFPAMIVEGSAPVVAFDSIGWGWGGRWSGDRDYQHFSSNGR